MQMDKGTAAERKAKRQQEAGSKVWRKCVAGRNCGFHFQHLQSTTKDNLLKKVRYNACGEASNMAQAEKHVFSMYKEGLGVQTLEPLGNLEHCQLLPLNDKTESQRAHSIEV